MRILKALIINYRRSDRGEGNTAVVYHNFDVVDQDDGGVVEVTWFPVDPAATLPKLNDVGTATLKARKNRGGQFIDFVGFALAPAPKVA